MAVLASTHSLSDCRAMGLQQEIGIGKASGTLQFALTPFLFRAPLQYMK